MRSVAYIDVLGFVDGEHAIGATASKSSPKVDHVKIYLVVDVDRRGKAGHKGIRTPGTSGDWRIPSVIANNRRRGVINRETANTLEGDFQCAVGIDGRAGDSAERNADGGNDAFTADPYEVFVVSTGDCSRVEFV